MSRYRMATAEPLLTIEKTWGAVPVGWTVNIDTMHGGLVVDCDAGLQAPAVERWLSEQAEVTYDRRADMSVCSLLERDEWAKLHGVDPRTLALIMKTAQQEAERGIHGPGITSEDVVARVAARHDVSMTALAAARAQRPDRAVRNDEKEHDMADRSAEPIADGLDPHLRELLRQSAEAQFEGGITEEQLHELTWQAERDVERGRYTDLEAALAGNAVEAGIPEPLLAATREVEARRTRVHEPELAHMDALHDEVVRETARTEASLGLDVPDDEARRILREQEEAICREQGVDPAELHRHVAQREADQEHRLALEADLGMSPL
ncbi:hypothetical protein ABT324_30840 [Saccharopolyspora sp. NPDC000359]|uniref:hypothetical protein n=1 Tax=Saccharopolyspora sp. NPDC000359 TaxID=3154251 RepID=UPI00332A8DFB